MRFSRIKRHLGIDIDQESVKWVELSQGGSGVVVHGYGVRLYSSGHSDEELDNLLSELVKTGQIESRQAHVAVPSCLTLKQNICLAKPFQEKEIEDSLLHDQNAFFPGIEERLAFDFFENGNNEISVIAVRQRDINKQINMLLKCGIEVISVEPDIYAIVRLVFLAHEVEDEANIYMLVDDSQLVLRAIIFNYNEILFEINFADLGAKQSIELMWDSVMQRIQLHLEGKEIKTVFFMANKLYRDFSSTIKFHTLLVDPYKKIPSFEVDMSDKASLMLALGLAVRKMDGMY